MGALFLAPLEAVAANEILSAGRLGMVAVYEEDVYIPQLEKGELVSLNSKSGEENWRISVEASTPAVTADGTIYFISNRQLRAVGPSHGQELWSTELPGSYEVHRLASPAIGAAGTVYVRLPEELIAVDGANGEIRWSSSMASGSEASSELLSPFVYQPSEVPAGENENGIVFAVAGNKLCAFDTDDGAPRWTFEAATQIESSPVLSREDRIYIPSANKIDVIDSLTGPTPKNIENPFIHIPYAITGVVVGRNRRLYLTTGSDRVDVYDTRTGTKSWSRDVGATGHPPVVAANGNVYVSAFERAIDNSENDDLELIALDGRTREDPMAGTDSHYFL